MQLQTSIQAGLINLTFSSQATKGIFLIGLGQVRNTFVSRVFQKRQVSLNFGVLNNIYLYISSIMTNSRPVAGFLLVLYPPEISDKIPFFHGQNIIGRSQSKATLVIKQVSISQKHARLFATSKKITLTDLGSKNGTKINNEDNLLETLKEVEVDDSMVIYFAQAKCKIEVVKNREEEVSKKDVEAREKERKRAELLKKMEQQSFKHSNEAKPAKDQFKKITFINDIDLNEDFVAEIPKNEKADKIQKQVKKKNPKISKPLATDNSNQKKSADKKPKKNKSDEKHQKKQKNNKKQMQVKTNENSLSKQYRKDQQKTLLSVKMKPIKEKQQKKVSVSPKQQSKSKPKSKSPKIIKNQKEASKQKLGQSRRKNLRIQNQKLQQQRNSTSKQAKKKDKAAKKQLSLQKQAAQPIKSRDKQLKPEIKVNKKSKEKLKMNKTMPSKLQQKDHSKQQDEITNTTKKRVGTRKKLPSQSLEKDLRQSGRRNALGKRVLFSGFVPKMRRKFFTIVQDYTGDFDYLVMKQYTRTFKALVSIAKGIPIVKNTWIQDSEHCQRTMNPNHYRFSKIQYIYDAIDRVNAGQKVFQNYQIYLVSKEYHMKSQQIQALIKFGGGQIKALKGQLKVKDPRKSIAIVRNKEENVTILSSLKEQNQKAKKLGFQLIYTIEFLLEACEKQKIDWQNNKIP